MSLIKLIDKGHKGPGTALCPRCKKEMVFDISRFKNDITQVVEVPCPYCKGKLFTCILILTNTNMPALMNQLTRVINAAKGK